MVRSQGVSHIKGKYGINTHLGNADYLNFLYQIIELSSVYFPTYRGWPRLPWAHNNLVENAVSWLKKIICIHFQGHIMYTRQAYEISNCLALKMYDM